MKKKGNLESSSEINTLVRFEKDPDFKSLYVNNVAFGFTRFDFQMTIGLVEITKDESATAVKELASIKMTHGYAKALLQDLGAVIGAYEKQYGEILIPQDLKK